MRTRTKTSGFSLTELMIVVTIIGIMIAVGIPTITNWMRLYRLRAASQEVASELQHARLQAVMKTTTNGVVLQAVDADSYRFINLDLWNSPDPDLKAQAIGPLRELPEPIVFDSAPVSGTTASALSFSRLGAVCPVDATNCTKAVDLPPCSGGRCGDNRTTTEYMKSDAVGTTTIRLFDSRYSLRRAVEVRVNGRISEIAELP